MISNRFLSQFNPVRLRLLRTHDAWGKGSKYSRKPANVF
jgi:hypothetical protein